MAAAERGKTMETDSERKMKVNESERSYETDALKQLLSGKENRSATIWRTE